MNNYSLKLSRQSILECDNIRGFTLFPSNYICKREVADDLYSNIAFYPQQTHSLNLMVVKNNHADVKDTDALLTFEENLTIGVRTADCVPILIYSPDLKGIGAIHAGWKGTLGGIVDKVLDELEIRGGDISELIVSFGPSISETIYEVDEELATKFRIAGFERYISYPDGNDHKPHIDLQGVNMERFLRRGVRKDNIKLSDECTYSSKKEDCTFKYQSYRRDKDRAARNLTAICRHKDG